MRFYTLVSGLLLVGQALQAQTTESAVAAPLDSPWKAIQHSLSALRSGNFEAYVNTLTTTEQDAQAGYIFYVSSAFNIAKTDLEPREKLALRIIEAVKEKHLIPRGRWTKEQQEMATIPSQMFTMALSQALTPAGYGSSYASTVTPSSSATMRDKCRKMGTLFHDRQSFLVELLTEWSQPLLITKDGKSITEQEIPNELKGLIAVYEKADWTIYQRGKFAIAVGKVNVADATADVQARAHPTVPNSSNEPAQDLSIELRVVDSEWKIHRLFPDLEMVTMTGPRQTAAINQSPYPPASAYKAR